MVSTGSSTSAASSAAPAHFSVASAGRSGASGGALLRLTPCGLPSSPHGRPTSTTAITRNSATSVSLEKEKATPSTWTVPMPTHSALISAMSSAAM